MRIIGVNIPDHERVVVSLTRLYGIGPVQAAKLLRLTKINPDTRVNKLTKEEIGDIIKALDSFKTEGDLRKEVRENINRLKSIKTYRGLRHIVSLPVRGQNTRTNSRTRKGKKKTVGSLTKEAWAKIEAQQKAAQAVK